jgi:hypothetical protein
MRPDYHQGGGKGRETHRLNDLRFKFAVRLRWMDGCRRPDEWDFGDIQGIFVGSLSGEN